MSLSDLFELGFGIRAFAGASSDGTRRLLYSDDQTDTQMRVKFLDYLNATLYQNARTSESYAEAIHSVSAVVRDTTSLGKLFHCPDCIPLALEVVKVGLEGVRSATGLRYTDHWIAEKLVGIFNTMLGESATMSLEEIGQDMEAMLSSGMRSVMHDAAAGDEFVKSTEMLRVHALRASVAAGNLSVTCGFGGDDCNATVPTASWYVSGAVLHGLGTATGATGVDLFVSDVAPVAVWSKGSDSSTIVSGAHSLSVGVDTALTRVDVDQSLSDSPVCFEIPLNRSTLLEHSV